MRILFLTFYYQPDLSAGSFRAAALANALIDQGGDELHLDVLTTLPNRYRSFSVDAPEEEFRGNLYIRRFRLPTHQSGMADQAAAFASYALQVLTALRGRRYDLVLATSSRLMTAVLAAVEARRLSAPLYLDIRDIFTDTMRDILSGRPLLHVMPIFQMLERFAVRSAARVNIVSGGFEEHFHALVPKQGFSKFTNGIDEEFLRVSYVNPVPNARCVILYAGNIGEGQGLHRILPQAARILRDEVEFVVIGDGGARRTLESSLVAAKVNNVTLRRPVSRAELLEHYRRADILFLHLNDHEAFRKVLPSKVFEYAATGKPILAGVSGFAREFIRQHIPNAAVFAPCDPEGLVRAMRSLELGLTRREEFIHRFSRANIAAAMARDVLSLLGPAPRPSGAGQVHTPHMEEGRGTGP